MGSLVNPIGNPYYSNTMPSGIPSLSEAGINTVIPDNPLGFNQSYQNTLAPLTSEPTFSLPSPVSTGTYYNPSTGSEAGSIPTFSTTVTAQAPTGDYTGGLPDPLAGLNLPNNLPSANTLLEQLAGGDIANGPLGSGLGSVAQQTAGVAASGVATPVQAPAWLQSLIGGYSWGRVGTFLLALILIAAGLYLFGLQSKTIQTVARRAGRLAFA